MDTVESLSTAALQTLNIPPIDRITQSTNEDNQIVNEESSDEIPLPNLNESTITVSNAIPITDVRQMQSTTETIEPISSLGTRNPLNTMPRQLVQRSITFSATTMTRPITSQPQTIIRSNTRITNLRRPEPQRVTEIRTNSSTSDLRNLAPQPAPQRVTELRASISNSALQNQPVPQLVPQVASRPSLQRLSPLRGNTSNSTRQVQPGPQSTLRATSTSVLRNCVIQQVPQRATVSRTSSLIETRLRSTGQSQPITTLRTNSSATNIRNPAAQAVTRTTSISSNISTTDSRRVLQRINELTSHHQPLITARQSRNSNEFRTTSRSSFLMPTRVTTMQSSRTINVSSPQSTITRPRTLSSSPHIRNPIDISARAAGVFKSPLTRQAPSNVTRVSSQSDKTKLCDVCFEKPKTHAFFPCGHVSTCEKCCIRISQERKHCVICNARVKSTLKIYFT